VTRQARRELLTALAWLLGWAFVTAFAAALCGYSAVILSTGLLLLGLGGIRPLALLLWHGLNFLPRGDD